MKKKYVYNELVYVFTNFSVATNPLFIDQDDIEGMKFRLEKYITPLCEVVGYKFTQHEFQIMVRLKDRETFESFYIQKMQEKGRDFEVIPESTEILSQEMANTESGYALYFNYKYDRKGALFARRFTKILIESEEEFDQWLEIIHGEGDVVTQESRWRFAMWRMKGFGWLRKLKVSSFDVYLGKAKETIFSTFIMADKLKLQGRLIFPDG